MTCNLNVNENFLVLQTLGSIQKAVIWKTSSVSFPLALFLGYAFANINEKRNYLFLLKPELPGSPFPEHCIVSRNFPVLQQIKKGKHQRKHPAFQARELQEFHRQINVIPLSAVLQQLSCAVTEKVPSFITRGLDYSGVICDIQPCKTASVKITFF